jgi:hypothetical protein
MSRLKPIAVLLCAAAVLSSCDLFEENAVQDITGPLPASRIKFFNFGVGAPGVNFYANDTKMTAISSTSGEESTNGVNYGNAGANGMYLAIDPGQFTFSGRIAAATDKDLPISTVSATIEAGKYYSFYQSGIYDGTAKTVDAFVIEDVMPTGTIDFSVAHVRFVNAISNGTGDLNLFADNAQTTDPEIPIGGAVAYKAAGAFVPVPQGIYNLRAAYTGGANVVTRNTLSFVGGRVYTITSRGNTATASTLGLDFTQNQR